MGLLVNGGKHVPTNVTHIAQNPLVDLLEFGGQQNISAGGVRLRTPPAPKEIIKTFSKIPKNYYNHKKVQKK